MVTFGEIGHFDKTSNLQMKESFKQKMQENKPHLTFKNTKKNICLEIKTGIFFDADPYSIMGPFQKSPRKNKRQ